MRSASIALFVLAVLPTAALRAESRLLRGTVGKYPVVMQLDESDGDVSGTYFYEKYKQDIPLRGAPDKQGYKLSSAAYDSDQAKSDRFLLTRTGDGFKGTFTSGKGASLPVELHAVAAGSVPAPRPDLKFARPLADYEKLRLADLHFVPGKQETVGGKYQIQWFSEPLSKVSMFHVTGGYPDAAMAAINRTIDAGFYTGLQSYFGCANGEGGSGVESLEVSSHYLDERFVSYAVSSSWSCYGAAHPDFSVDGTTIDAATGKELALEDLYWLGTGKKPAEHSDAWSQYREKVYAPAVVKLLQRLYPDAMKGDDGDGCDYTDPGVWDFGPWYLTDKGLYVGAYFARVARNCDNPDWSVIPYSVLKKNNPALFGH
ncbi:hypothetical protein ABZR86_02830 [Dyella marensis]|uniref:Uncharacterized protein n=1 Tax=Dyella marensis TaxID=500610 RepID=A0A1I1ZWI3_9GAMM|nr:MULTISPECIES: hypothetical protein [Dyella]SFE34910.1 hypothetical protein SAMN02799615_00809 [Dyella marensis]